MIFLLVLLIVFVEHTIANLTPTPTVENDNTVNLLKRVSQAPQPSCTWEGHCLGDNCHSNDDCDFEWVCTDGKCAVDGSTPLSTSVKVPVTSTGISSTPMSTSVKVPVTSTGISSIPTSPQSISSHPPDTAPSMTAPAVSSITLVPITVTIVTTGATNAALPRPLGDSYVTTSTFVSAASSSTQPTPPRYGLSKGAKIGIGVAVPVTTLLIAVTLLGVILHARKSRAAALANASTQFEQRDGVVAREPMTEYTNVVYKRMDYSGEECRAPQVAELSESRRGDIPVELPAVGIKRLG